MVAGNSSPIPPLPLQAATPALGRLVLFGLGLDERGAVVERPAVVVAVPPETPAGTCSLQVFVNGTGDYCRLLGTERAGVEHASTARHCVWRTRVEPGPGGPLLGRWRYPPSRT